MRLNRGLFDIFNIPSFTEFLDFVLDPFTDLSPEMFDKGQSLKQALRL